MRPWGRTSILRASKLPARMGTLRELLRSKSIAAVSPGPGRGTLRARARTPSLKTIAAVSPPEREAPMRLSKTPQLLISDGFAGRFLESLCWLIFSQRIRPLPVTGGLQLK